MNELEIILDAHRRDRIRAEIAFDLLVTIVVGIVVLIVLAFDKAVS